jgi:hypothetical protein
MRASKKSNEPGKSPLRIPKWIAMGITLVVCTFFLVAAFHKANMHAVALVFWFIGLSATAAVTAILFWADKQSD